jgi:hypothetical protein
MPLGRINGGLQGELPFAPTIRYSLPFAQSPVAIRHSLPLLSWLIATPTFSLPTFCLSSTFRLLVVYLSFTFPLPFANPSPCLLPNGRHKGLPLPFAIRHSLPFDQSPVAIR